MTDEEHEIVNQEWEKAHAVEIALKEQMERVKPYLNHKGDCLIYRDNYLEALMGGEDVERECNCGIEALKAELEGEQ